jgi:predicted NodU family carbamoyl transferase
LGRFPVASSVDGFGDFASAAWGFGNERSLTLDGRILFPHSLGIFYQALTQYLGFHSYGDEYKVMGLAAYGKAGPGPNLPLLLTQSRAVVLRRALPARVVVSLAPVGSSAP